MLKYVLNWRKKARSSVALFPQRVRTFMWALLLFDDPYVLVMVDVCPAARASEGKWHNHMIWLGGGCRDRQSHTHAHMQIVSWQAEPPCDNRPDGQRTRRAWLGKQHMTPKAIWIFVSLFNYVIFVSGSFEDEDERLLCRSPGLHAFTSSKHWFVFMTEVILASVFLLKILYFTINAGHILLP